MNNNNDKNSRKNETKIKEEAKLYAKDFIIKSLAANV